MGEVVQFIPANEIEVEVELEPDTVTLETVLEAMYSRHNIINAVIVYEDIDGDIKITSDDCEAGAIDLIAAVLEEY